MSVKQHAADIVAGASAAGPIAISVTIRRWSRPKTSARALLVQCRASWTDQCHILRITAEQPTSNHHHEPRIRDTPYVDSQYSIAVTPCEQSRWPYLYIALGTWCETSRVQAVIDRCDARQYSANWHPRQLTVRWSKSGQLQRMRMHMHTGCTQADTVGKEKACPVRLLCRCAKRSALATRRQHIANA